MTATKTTQRAEIVNRKGLHARASAKLSRLAAEYDAELTVSHEGQSAKSNSIMDLLMLVAHKGCVVELSATGLQADEAVAAVARLIEDGFGESGEADDLC